MSRATMVRTKMSFVFGATGTTATQKIQENGFIRKIIIVTPDMTAAATSTLTIKDAEGLTTYTSSAINEATTSTVGATIAAAATGTIPVDYNDIFTITLSEAAGAGGGTVIVVCYIEK
jgi:hypothetical protein